MDRIVVGLLLLAILSLINMVTAMKNKMNYMDKKLEDIMEHMDIKDDGLDKELMEFINMGEVVAAVKIARERTGMGLKEAKEYVDHLESK